MIETERLILKPYSLDFVEEFYIKFQSNKTYFEDYFSRTLSVTKTLEEAKLYFQKKIESCRNNEGFYFGIFLRGSDKLIGHISIREIDWTVPKGELAYFIFNDFSGNKYSYEALQAFRDFCMNEKEFVRIFMKIAPDNIASKKVAEFCNFEFEGLLKNDYRKRQEVLTDMLLYAFTR
ncbi:GNAT family N-acetyltransferase [Epilithonimonas hungarica]|uniref:Ribosomal-protein-alanine N-acetyltransferase n=1 Tax=Epilithonimonas hungarica TaxID=454006 RepID=A0A1G7J8Y9_9FLAO|nr:GNAT family N-acetyltransferase [Epilithonimonas hungarica]SDF21390.1 ribosomal-protein-alanine N-acetyltransferase [Epilithonimonas hungarica]